MALMRDTKGRDTETLQERAKKMREKADRERKERLERAREREERERKEQEELKARQAAAKKAAAEAEARKKAAEAEARRKAAEKARTEREREQQLIKARQAEAKKRAAEAEARKKAAEAEARKKAAAEAESRRKKLEEDRKKREAAAAKAAEAEAKKKAAEAEKKRKAALDSARKQGAVLDQYYGKQIEEAKEKQKKGFSDLFKGLLSGSLSSTIKGVIGLGSSGMANADKEKSYVIGPDSGQVIRKDVGTSMRRGVKDRIREVEKKDNARSISPTNANKTAISNISYSSASLTQIEIKPNKKYTIFLDVNNPGNVSKTEIESKLRSSFLKGVESYNINLVSVEYFDQLKKAKIIFTTGADLGGNQTAAAGVILLTIAGLIGLVLAYFNLNKVSFVVKDVKETAINAPGSVMWIALPAIVLIIGVVAWKNKQG